MQQEQGGGIRSLAAHPGLARTDLQPTAIASGGNRLEAVAYRLMDPLFQSAAMGALPQLHAATAATAQGGEHYGPDQLGGKEQKQRKNKKKQMNNIEIEG